MIVLAFNHTLTDTERHQLRQAFDAVKSGDREVVILEDCTIASDNALPIKGFIT